MLEPCLGCPGHFSSLSPVSLLLSIYNVPPLRPLPPPPTQPPFLAGLSYPHQFIFSSQFIFPMIFGHFFWGSISNSRVFEKSIDWLWVWRHSPSFFFRTLQSYSHTQATQSITTQVWNTLGDVDEFAPKKCPFRQLLGGGQSLWLRIHVPMHEYFIMPASCWPFAGYKH